MADVGEVAEEFVDAYNRFDMNALEELLDENVQLIHHNRGFATNGREETMALYRGTPDLIPDRKFGSREGFTVDGNVALIRHKLTGTPASDTPYGPAGEPLNFAITSVITVSDGGRVVKYEDYG